MKLPGRAWLEFEVHPSEQGRFALILRDSRKPGALQHLIPPWEKMKLVESAGSLKVGSKVVLRGNVGIFPIQWVAIHTEYDPPHLFADRQESGPFAYWHHRHRMLDDGSGGTVLSDEVEYMLRLGWIGLWLAGWLVRRRWETMFGWKPFPDSWLRRYRPTAFEPELVPFELARVR